MSQVEVVPGTFEKLDEMQCIQQTGRPVEWRREVLFQQLDLFSLERWSKENQAATHALISEYHDIFSLEPEELGCTDLLIHEIRVVDEEPFKERFKRIPPPMVDKVWAHVKEILEVGANCPSLNPLCNAVVLEYKKDGGMYFCIDFCKLNARAKKDSYLPPWIQESPESLVETRYFSCLDPNSGFGKLQWMRHQSSTLLSPW